MTELQRYDGGQAPALVTSTAPATDTDGWIRVVADVAKLSQEIANTDFVPDAMRGKPAAVTAAILAGREMGVGPMTALQHIHVIKGKPGQSAHLMRALVLAAGHEIEYIEVTDSRALIRGRRAGETNWTEAEFTAQQARTAKLDLGGYPTDKLIARATARLCRRKFADVISGLAYTVEELQDGDAQLVDAGEQPPALGAGDDPAPAPQQRTAQRPARRKAATKTSSPGKTANPAGGKDTGAAAPTPSGPPLPGEDGYDEPPPDRDAEPGEEAPLDPDGPATAAQNRMMHALFREASCSQREDRLHLTGLLLERQLDTSKGITVADAKAVIDALENLKASGHPEGLPGAVNDLINQAEQLRMEAEMDGGADTVDGQVVDEDQAADEQPAGDA